jgi:hypothetical protein
MNRPTEGCCGTCAWLAKSIKRGGSGAQPMYAVYDEAEPFFRENPSGDFAFVPVFYNAVNPGNLTCFRRVADLVKEADEEGVRSGLPGAPSWQAVLWKDRKCPMWAKYEPGISPREYFAEARAEKFTERFNKITTRLTLLAILVGLLQLLTMTPDSILYRMGKTVMCWLTR